MKIALVSDIEIERQYFVDSIAESDSVSYINEINTLTSSKVINAGRIMASENKVSIFGTVGEDKEAELTLRGLKYYGFDTKNVRSVRNAKTGQVIVMTDKRGKSALACI